MVLVEAELLDVGLLLCEFLLLEVKFGEPFGRLFLGGNHRVFSNFPPALLLVLKALPQPRAVPPLHAQTGKHPTPIQPGRHSPGSNHRSGSRADPETESGVPIPLRLLGHGS